MKHTAMVNKAVIFTDRGKIQEKYGKNLWDIDQYIQILKKWLKTQRHLPETPNDNMLEFFLTNCKFSIEKTKQNIDMYYTMRTIVPELYFHPNSPDLKLVDKMGNYVCLPKLTETMHRIVMINYHENTGDLFDPNKVMAQLINMYEIRLHEDLMMGEIWIVNAQHLSLAHIQKFNPLVLKKMVTYLDKVWRYRLKEVHIFNYPPYIDMLMTLVKMFIKKKLYERVHLHKTVESVFEYIPRDILPSDFGGKENSLQELTEAWKIKFKEYEQRFNDLENMKVDESLRPEPLTNSDVLGYYGNFKKIDVD